MRTAAVHHCGQKRSSYARCSVESQVVSSPPHARGGVPYTVTYARPEHASSPRMWGCSDDAQAPNGPFNLLPTHAGYRF